MEPKYNRYEFRVLARWRRGNRQKIFRVMSTALSLEDAKKDVAFQLKGLQIENIQLKSINFKY